MIEKEKELLQEGERLDEIGFSDYKLIQKPKEFCYGIDAVLLADFAKVKKNGSVCDLGTGTAILPLILSHKTEASRIVGVEFQKDSYERGLRNVALNSLEEKVKLIHGDVKDCVELLKRESFDAVVSNPPYMSKNGGLKNAGTAKMLARHESTAELEDFLEVAFQLLRDKGDFYMVHRPSRLTDIIALCRSHHLEPKELQFIAPSLGRKPNILLLHCVKNGNPEIKCLPSLFVYCKDGSYSDEVLHIYEKR